MSFLWYFLLQIIPETVSSDPITGNTLSSTFKGESIELSDDCLVAQWPPGHGVPALVGSERPISPPSDVKGGEDLSPSKLWSYFEVSLEVEASQKEVSIGLVSAEQATSRRHVGWDANAIGYHGDDGNVFSGAGWRAVKYGPAYRAPATVGCFACLLTNVVIFTLNGKPLWKNANSQGVSLRELFPAVCAPGEARVRFNFGSQPFVYRTLHEMAKSLSLPLIPTFPR